MFRPGRKQNTEEPEESASWIVTYSDLVTLLLTFFILLFSMATIDIQKFDEIAESLRSAFQHMSSGGETFNSNQGKDIISLIEDTSAIDINDKMFNPQTDMQEEKDVLKNANDQEEYEEKIIKAAEEIRVQRLEKAKEEIQGMILELGLSEHVYVVEEQHMITFRVNSQILFDSGKADIKQAGSETLLKLGNFLNELDNEIIVLGHTDNRPINTYLFDSNWELSTKRATNIVRFLQDECHIKPSKLTAAGNGEYKPIKPNDTPENRQQNRRIDIVVIK
jgi:chemotaxis protein MotB